MINCAFKLKNILAAAFVLLISGGMLMAQTKVVAHRGHWKTEGSAQNSIASLKCAHEVGAYACEFDVNMTSDGVLVVCHGPQIGNLPDVQKATFAEVMAVTLENGEKVPTLEQFLKAGKKGYKVKQADGSVKSVKLQLVLELKPDSPELEAEIVAKASMLVKKLKMEKQVDIISFSLNVCQEAVKQLPNSTVQYLTGNLTPYELKNMGITGIDYHYSLLILNPEWIEQAHDLGMVVNCWTVDAADKIETMVQLGVDYITTNEPELTLQLIEKHSK